MPSLRGIFRNKLAGTLLICISALILLHVGLRRNVLDELEAVSWDIRLRLTADPRQADQSVKLIVVDQHSLDQLHELYGFSWPIPRGYYPAVIKFLTLAGARGVAFDLLFSEPSVYGEDDDRDLVESLAGSMPVVMAAGFGNSGQQVLPERIEQLRKVQQEHPESLPARGPGYSSATLPLPDLLEQSAALGAVNAIPDRDGVIRRYLIDGTFRPAGSEPIPFLGLAPALYRSVMGPEKLKLAARAAGIGSEPIIGYHGPSGSYPTFSLSDIIQSWAAIEEGKTPLIDPGQFKDSWIFIGVWAPGLMDQRITPLDSHGRGVDIHAAVLDNLLNNRFIRRWGNRASLLTAAPFFLILIFGVIYSQRILQQVLASAIAFSGLTGSAVLLARAGIWVDLFFPLVLLGTVLAAAMAYQYFLEGHRSRFLRQAFQHYVSPVVIDRLVKDPQGLALGGERRELTLFFSDIAGFTSISERLDPDLVSALLNEYLSLMTDIIQAHNGTVDKFVGDAVVAFWNAPLPAPDHQRQAVEAAIECQKELAEMRGDFLKRYGAELHTRIGIHTGLVSVGNFGAKDRFNYTVIGDAANLASRLEGTNKLFHTEILVSEATRRGAGSGILFRRIGRIHVVGREEPVAIFEPVGIYNDWTPERCASFNSALAMIESGNLPSAREELIKFRGDTVADLLLENIEQADKGCPSSEDLLTFRATEK